MIDYETKLTTHRAMNEIKHIDGSIESDRGRIISSPSLRRLQKRTQVFPLELNAAVRSRLTHSLEVQQTSRYIAKSILNLIEQNGDMKKFGLKDLDNAFVSTSEMSALLHDIGNPPFGHFAELAISNWIQEQALEILSVLYPKLTKKSIKFQDFLLRDLTNVDGNAQAIRIVHKLQRLNLSYTQTAAILKYTRGAFEVKPDDNDKLSYIKKKPGYYFSEKSFVEKIWKTLKMKPGTRFPITYIMEAADDISYLTADLEDAVDKGILTFDDLYQLILDESKAVNIKNKTKESFLSELVKNTYERVQSEDTTYQFNMFWTLVRATLINKLVSHVSNVYINNHDEIFKGTFNHSLLEFECETAYQNAVDTLRNISVRYIYKNREVETLELKGHAILTGLFNIYKPILQLTKKDILRLVNGNKIDNVLAMKLFRRLSQKHIIAYSNSITNMDDSYNKEEKRILEWYYRARLLIDYISGMTDDYVLSEYQILSAIK